MWMIFASFDLRHSLCFLIQIFWDCNEIENSTIQHWIRHLVALCSKRQPKKKISPLIFLFFLHQIFSFFKHKKKTKQKINRKGEIEIDFFGLFILQLILDLWFVSFLFWTNFVIFSSSKPKQTKKLKKDFLDMIRILISKFNSDFRLFNLFFSFSIFWLFFMSAKSPVIF